MPGRATNQRKQYEGQLIKLFEEHGYVGMRSVASLGCADVFVYSGNGDIRLIQVKTSEKPLTDNANVSLLATALQRLQEAPYCSEIRKQIWFKHLRHDWVFLELDWGAGILTRKDALSIIKDPSAWRKPYKGEIEANDTIYGYLRPPRSV